MAHADILSLPPPVERGATVERVLLHWDHADPNHIRSTLSRHADPTSHDPEPARHFGRSHARVHREHRADGTATLLSPIQTGSAQPLSSKLASGVPGGDRWRAPARSRPRPVFGLRRPKAACRRMADRRSRVRGVRMAGSTFSRSIRDRYRPGGRDQDPTRRPRGHRTSARLVRASVIRRGKTIGLAAKANDRIGSPVASDEVEGVIRKNGDLWRRRSPPDTGEMMTERVGRGDLVLLGRGMALVDPTSKGRTWLMRSRADGRRSPAPFADYADAARRLGR